jgi:transposase InsO family protein
MLGIRHIRTRPYTPKTNGKAERFIQTMLREWAYAIPFKSSDRRAADLPRWLAWYNQQRPHASLDKRTPAQALAGTT